MEGHWQILRAGQAKAVARSAPDAPIEHLAHVIGLRADEERQWLTPGPPTTVAPRRECAVPNTVFMIWTGDGWYFGRLAIRWYREILHFRRLGFKVEPRYFFDTSPAQFLDELARASGSRELHGLFVEGHGATWNFGTGAGKRRWGGGWTTDYRDLDQALRYRLGMVIVNACHGGWARGDADLKGPINAGARDLAAHAPGENGTIFYGIKRVLIPFVDTCHAWHVYGKGEQGTVPRTAILEEPLSSAHCDSRSSFPNRGGGGRAFSLAKLFRRV
jgi:hypothetical protein